MRYDREAARARSNNPRDANRNACALAVASALGVDRAVRYLHTFQDVLLLGSDGQTLIDTDPRARDRRKIKHLYGIFKRGTA